MHSQTISVCQMSVLLLRMFSLTTSVSTPENYRLELEYLHNTD
jgi:hypothetical protein